MYKYSYQLLYVECNHQSMLQLQRRISYTAVTVTTWASYQIRTIVGCARAGNAGNVFPATDFRGNRQLAIPACITARASRTCRDACWDRSPAGGGENVPGILGACTTRCFVSGKKSHGWVITWLLFWGYDYFLNAGWLVLEALGNFQYL